MWTLSPSSGKTRPSVTFVIEVAPVAGFRKEAAAAFRKEVQSLLSALSAAPNGCDLREWIEAHPECMHGGAANSESRLVGKVCIEVSCNALFDAALIRERAKKAWASQSPRFLNNIDRRVNPRT